MGTAGTNVGIGCAGRAALFLVALLTACVSLATPAGAAEPPVLLGSFGPDGTSGSNFSKPGAIAVDQTTGDVYALDPGTQTLYRFGPDGEPLAWAGSAPDIDGNAITGFSTVTGNAESQVAVDAGTHRIYVTDRHAVVAFDESGEPSVFSSGPGAGSNQIGGFAELLGVAVDADGVLYASDFGDEPDGSHGKISIFARSGAPLTSVQFASPGNVAVSPTGALFVNRYRSPIFELTPSSFPVEAATAYQTAAEPIDPRSASGLSVDPTTGDLYAVLTAGNEFVASRFDSSGTLLTNFGGPGEQGELTFSAGIAFDSHSEQVFVSNGGAIERFGRFVPPVLPPEVVSTSVSRVTADSARLEAEINPHTLATNFHFEYGTGDCSAPGAQCVSAPLPEGSLGGGFIPVAVSEDLAGLSPGTAYHYRVVAKNALGGTDGPDRTFVTQDLGGAALADGRGWELVSPANKQGGGKIVPSAAIGVAQASAAGDAFAFLTIGAIEDGVEGNRAFDPSQSLARHSGSGWLSRDVTPPSATTSPVSGGNQFRLFSPELETAAVEPWSPGNLSAEASEKTPYLRQNFSAPVRWRPLVTGREGFANVPPGTHFGGGPDEQLREFRGLVRIRGASVNLEHVVLASQVALSADAVGVLPEFGVRNEATDGLLYQWTAGSLDLVSVLPAGEGGVPVAGAVGSTGNLGEGVSTTAVSESGRFVFWTDEVGSALYVRDTQAGETIRLDETQPGAAGGGADLPIFQGASPDGRRAFFTDTRQLVEGAGETGADLYECALVEQGGRTRCELRDVTPAVGGEAADVRGLITGMGADGSRVYFVANGALAAGAPKGNCGHGKSPALEACSLYLAERDGTSWDISSVATLSGGDAPDWGLADPTARRSGAAAMNRPAAVSPSGRYLAFMSSRPLTGYDNTDVAGGLPDEEVFRFDAAGPKLVCVSCNPTGGRPAGELQPSKIEALAVISPVDGLSVWERRWLAANLADPNVPENGLGAYYQPRSVLDDGRVFFNAFDSLVPADVGGGSDVYEYEPSGTGSCGNVSASASTARSAGGCISLLSGGTSGRDAGFLDASADGEDAFFISAAQLDPADTDLADDVYDAHVCGSRWGCPPPPTPASPPCSSAEACRAGSTNGIEAGVPASATFAETRRPRRRHPRRHEHRRKKEHRKHRHPHRHGGSK